MEIHLTITNEFIMWMVAIALIIIALDVVLSMIIEVMSKYQGYKAKKILKRILKRDLDEESN